MQKFSEHIFLIDTEALSYRQSVAIYLIRAKKTALVDVGYASSVNTVLKNLECLGVPLKEIDYLIPTHIHLDHAGATGTLFRLVGHPTVYVHERGLKHLANPIRLVESAKEIFGPDVVKLFGEVKGVPEDSLSAVSDEQALDLGDGVTLTVFHTPGHAPHHVSILEEKSRSLITGDAVGIRYPEIPVIFPTTPPPSFDPDQAIQSLERLVKLDAKLLLMPHFGILETVTDSLRENIEKIRLWQDRVEDLVKRGLTFPVIYKRLLDLLSSEAKMKPKHVPEYAKMSVRINTMGWLQFLRRAGRE